MHFMKSTTSIARPLPWSRSSNMLRRQTNCVKNRQNFDNAECWFPANRMIFSGTYCIFEYFPHVMIEIMVGQDRLIILVLQFQRLQLTRGEDLLVVALTESWFWLIRLVFRSIFRLCQRRRLLFARRCRPSSSIKILVAHAAVLVRGLIFIERV